MSVSFLFGGEYKYILYVEANLSSLLSFVYKRIAFGNPVIEMGGSRSINRFNPATFLCLSQTRNWIFNYICRDLFCVFSELRREVRFVDTGGIIDHHCLNILFITILNQNSLGNREQPNVPLLIYYLTKRYLYNYLSYQLSSCYTISLELHKCSMDTCFCFSNPRNEHLFLPQ